MKVMPAIGLHNLRGDLFGGITAGVVALPLALAFGVASGAGPIAGLYGAICVGFFAAVFGGTPSQVSGPTGPMTVVFAAALIQFADQPALAFTAVFAAGMLQILFGVVGLGKYIRLVPFPVISGFMSGVGVIIILLQLERLLGHVPPEGTLKVLADLPRAIADINWHASVLGFGTLALVWVWPKRLSGIVPGPLAALIIGTLAAAFVLPAAPVVGAIPSGLPSLHWPAIDAGRVNQMVNVAFVLALLGTIDSLLTSLIADNLTRTRHDSRQELIGQGFGNAVAGLFGGLPGAGATMRTVINIRTGGRTGLSGAFHALLLVAVVLGLGPLASNIPHAVLAGILVKVGIDIIDWSYLKRALRAPRADVALMVLVLALTVFVDLITAVGVGVIIASLMFVKSMADVQLASISQVQPMPEASAEEERLLAAAEGRVVEFSFGGPLSFGAASELATRIHVTEGMHALVLDFSRVPFIDTSAALAVEDIVKTCHSQHRRVYLAGVAAPVMTTLERLNLKVLFEAQEICPDRLSALRRAVSAVAPAG